MRRPTGSRFGENPHRTLMNLVKEPNRFHWWMIDRPKWCPVVVEHLRICNTCTKRLEFSRVSVLSRQVWSGWICSKFCCHRHFSPRLFHVKRRNGGQWRNNFHQAWARMAGAERNSWSFLLLYLFNINFNYRSPCDAPSNLWICDVGRWRIKHLSWAPFHTLVYMYVYNYMIYIFFLNPAT